MMMYTPKQILGTAHICEYLKTPLSFLDPQNKVLLALQEDGNMHWRTTQSRHMDINDVPALANMSISMHMSVRKQLDDHVREYTESTIYTYLIIYKYIFIHIYIRMDMCA